MEDQKNGHSHEHKAWYDPPRHVLWEFAANEAKWATGRDGQSNEHHEHVRYAPLDLVHDHGRGPHHHHISVIDGVAGLLYWLPSAHPPSDETSRLASREAWDEWVRDLTENLPPVTPNDYI